jgi:hypothetical protein
MTDDDEMIDVMIGGEAKTIRLDHAIELSRAITASVARHVNQRNLTVIQGGASDSTSTDG